MLLRVNTSFLEELSTDKAYLLLNHIIAMIYCGCIMLSIIQHYSLILFSTKFYLQSKLPVL